VNGHVGCWHALSQDFRILTINGLPLNLRREYYFECGACFDSAVLSAQSVGEPLEWFIDEYASHQDLKPFLFRPVEGKRSGYQFILLLDIVQLEE